MASIDSITLNFSPESLVLMNVVIGFIMFGVALDMRPRDFDRHVIFSKGIIVGAVSQFLLLPAFTYVLIYILEPRPSIALGMILVAACPGGNLSNFMAHLAKGNTALSVTMTAVSTVLAVVMTPLNVSFWGSLNPETNELLKQVYLSPLDMFLNILMILGIPLILGMSFAALFPKVTRFLQKFMKYLSIVVFLAFVVVALKGNFQYFLDYVGMVAFAVFLHNALALLTGYFGSAVSGLQERDRRAVAIETGIQNSGLGLILIFNFFSGLGGMAVVAAWWGIWHIISGLTVSGIWSFFTPEGYYVPGDSDHDSDS